MARYADDLHEFQGGNELTWNQEWPGGVCPSVQKAGSALLRLGGQLKGNEVGKFTQAEGIIC